MRRPLLLLASTAAIVLCALGNSQQKPPLLLLDWANKAHNAKAPVAVLIELGLRDTEPTSWSGRAVVKGARLVDREGYRFLEADALLEPDGWKASSYLSVRPLGARGPRQPPARRQAGRGQASRVIGRIATVGVVLHLTDITPQASISIEAGEENGSETVALADVIAGGRKPLWDGKGVVRRVSSEMPVATEKTEDDFPAAAYGPDGSLWVAYVSYTVKDERRRRRFMEIREQPGSFASFVRPDFGDQLFVKVYRESRWSAPVAVTGPHEDLMRCAITVAGDGKAYLAYSGQRDGKFQLFTRSIERTGDSLKLGTEERLTRGPGPTLTPAMCTDQAGNVHLAAQQWNEQGAARIVLFQNTNGNWSAAPTLDAPAKGNNRWYPALAASPDGNVAVAYDVYQDGDYDVHVAVVDGKQVKNYPVASSPRFEARPAIAYDPQGRLWIAYEIGPERWGKNYGALETDRGNPLYNIRSVEVACLVDGRLFRPAAELPDSSLDQRGRRPRAQPHNAYPRIGVDGKGRVWLAYRVKLPTPFGPEPGTNWLEYARRLVGDTWSAPVEIAHADGLLDSRPVLLPEAGGGLLVVSNTDGRYTTPDHLGNQVYASVVDLPGDVREPKLVAATAPEGRKDDSAERAAVERVRRYRVERGGKQYRLLRGDFHRHTEISFDGDMDGSLEDFFRYGLDAASLDWIANTDHDSGHGREYAWWLIQKSSDAYHVPGAFTPMFAYERSVPYPMGHRNVLFARRGILTLPRLGERDPGKRVAGVNAQDTQMLYRYLKELNGLCASHTSATNMGTDWRDNDVTTEPAVEIYQGDRNSYEKQGAPRAGHDPKSGEKPANIAGWYPKGYINLALERGYRFAFESSSDHISTHISYTVVLAEENTREAIFDAIKHRRCYAATEDIAVDVNIGGHGMGEEFRTNEAPTLNINIFGAKPLARVEILKDSNLIQPFTPGKEEFRERWTDPNPTKGTHYYYVRAQQDDGELAWSSPTWVDYAP
jgi:hypothetical protein